MGAALLRQEPSARNYVMSSFVARGREAPTGTPWKATRTGEEERRRDMHRRGGTSPRHAPARRNVAATCTGEEERRRDMHRLGGTSPRHAPERRNVAATCT